ncbi:MAG: hypothetical protein KC609_03265 [Myxococcales bacterium]|nr:hypothetical protein [Myxococcales bacterium]
MERVIEREQREKLERRSVLPLDTNSAIAIKRDVHEFVVNTSAERFAEAFRRVVTDPENVFGLIRVKRPSDRLGKEFEVGERFQGCFSVELAISGALGADGGDAPGAHLAPKSGLFASKLFQRSVAWFEDQFMSNYAEIESIEMEPDLDAGECYRLRYRYLDGTPIAGSSTFTIEPLAANRCRFTQVFEFQEQNGVALATFQRFGLKFHDQVVYQQVAKAAALCGVAVESGTIPAAYGEIL